MRVDHRKEIHLPERKNSGKRPCPVAWYFEKQLKYLKTPILPSNANKSLRILDHGLASHTFPYLAVSSKKPRCGMFTPEMDGHLQMPSWIPAECDTIFTQPISEVCEMVKCESSFVKFRVRRGKSLCLKTYPETMASSRRIISYTIQNTQLTLRVGLFEENTTDYRVYKHTSVCKHLNYARVAY